jgi:hypothetical protein
MRAGALIFAAWMACAQVPAPKYTPPPPPQPIPFSHKQHLVMNLECKSCHEMPDPGDFAGLPSTARCMSCHSEVKRDSPSIQRLAGHHKDGKPVPWARVYRIPDYVFFSHKEHVARGRATCETCHGPVREREVLRKEKDLSMGACMECHRANNASVACDYCHDQR